MNFKKKFEKIQELIDFVKEHTAEMDKASFLSSIGTIMKLYSIEHDIPMEDFMIEFVAGVFAAEGVLPGLFNDDDDK